MRSLISKFSLILLVFTILSSQLFSGDDLKEMKKTIEGISDKLVRAIIDGDVETIFSYYTDDAVSMPNYGEMVKGKEALKKHDEEMRKTGFKIHSMNFTILDLWACGDLVYEIGKYGISLTLPGMSQPVADNGKYLTIWQKQSDGSLKIKIEIWNTDTNPLAMAKEH
ncbi:MAG: YybH family protein [Candidatus Aminicenantia bacterium]